MIPIPKIVFVDDEPNVLAGLKRLLRPHSKTWDMAFLTDPEEALRAIVKAPPHVAVLDIRMPKLDGIALARAIHAKAPQVVCIILSGSTEFDLAVSSINEGHVFRYYVKPCPTEDLVAGIQAALSVRQRRKTDQSGTAIGGSEEPDAVSRAPLDLIPYGVVVVGASGHTLFTNEKAAAMMSDDCGLFLDPKGVCRAMDIAATQRLWDAIETARSEETTTALSVEATSGSLLRITVEPYRGDGTASARPVCLFLFSDDVAEAPSPGLLRDMFGLSVSESRLAAALTKGLSLDEAATECGVTKSSARTYLKNVFSKLGVSRQAELVRVILVSLASR